MTPQTRISPWRGISPAIANKSDVLPDPLSPISAALSPGARKNDNDQFDWTAAAEAKLQANGMVALPGNYPSKRFDQVYSLLKNLEMPILVTTDSTLHLYHIFFDQILKNVEVREFIPILRALLPELARAMASVYEALQGDLKEAARRDLAFISVAGRLLDPQHFAIHQAVADEVNTVVEYIETAGANLPGGREISPIFNRDCSRDLACAGQDLAPEDYDNGKACYCEDYTQYKPRGHYTEAEELELYFRSAMYLGRMSMRIKSPMETRMATSKPCAPVCGKNASPGSSPALWTLCWR